jgi:hypothetical protein
MYSPLCASSASLTWAWRYLFHPLLPPTWLNNHPKKSSQALEGTGAMSSLWWLTRAISISQQRFRLPARVNIRLVAREHGTMRIMWTQCSSKLSLLIQWEGFRKSSNFGLKLKIYCYAQSADIQKELIKGNKRPTVVGNSIGQHIHITRMACIDIWILMK